MAEGINGPYHDKLRRCWRCKVTTEGHVRWVTAKTEAEALARAIALRDRPTGAALTVSEATQRYIKSRIEANVWRPASLKRARIDLAEFAVPADTDLRKVDKAWLLRYVSQTGHLALATRKKRWVTVMAFLRWCVVEDLLEHTPAAKIDSAKLPWHGKQAQEEMGAGKEQLPHGRAVLQYLAAAQALPDPLERVAAQLPILTNMRNGEVCHMRVGDVDEVFNCLWIRSSRVWTKRSTDWRVKTQKSTREHAIPPELAKDLATLCLRPDGSRRPDADILLAVTWHSPKGKQVTPHKGEWLVNLIARVCKQAGLPKVTPHGMRGTYSSALRATGLPPADVAQRMGHADAGVTLRNAYQGVPDLVPALSLVRERPTPAPTFQAPAAGYCDWAPFL